MTQHELALRRLAESEAKFRATFENAAVGMAHMAPNGSWLRVNDRLCQITAYTVHELRAMTDQDITHPDDLAADLLCMARMMAGEIASYHIEKRYVRRNGVIVWVNKTVSGVRTDTGQIDYLISIVEDITAKKEAEGDRRHVLRLIDNILNTAPVSIYIFNCETGKIELMNARVRELLGYDVSTWTQKTARFFDLMHPDDRGRFTDHFQRLEVDTPGKIHEFEYRMRHADGGWRWFLSRDLVYERAADGRLVKVLSTAADITERKHAEEHTQMLMREVNHRAKNLLGVVQSVAWQTAIEGNPMTFVERLSDRIQALSASQDLLVRSLWTGVDVGELVHTQLSHLRGLFGTRLIIDGPAARLTPAAAQGIGMALHELATNAAKYGALSNTTGRVTITWQLSQMDRLWFIMRWQEEGGPEVVTPTRTGFRQKVLGPMAEAVVGGKVAIEYLKPGLRWTLSAPATDALQRERPSTFALSPRT